MKQGSLLLFPMLALHMGNTAAAEQQKERPNILWLTFEDTSAYEFGCYGNKQVHTPNIDRLAAEGIQYMNAWSVAPQSSPARSSLITGCYATTYGMDVHPVPYDTPDHIFFPQWLREAGYYCVNNSKTHYNTTTDNRSCWDDCSAQATYNSPKRKEQQPFFAVFNTVTSHMGRVRTFHTEGRRDYTQEGIYPDKLVLPPHVPDLPEVRSDYAGHLEASQDVDKWVGFFLKDLKEKGLDQNTIIFVFSDHGGCLPRGKGYLYETGLRVPLVAYFPERWKSLAGQVGIKDSSLVNFTDLGPTVLSLAGLKTPPQMQGKALLGEYANKKKREMQFALAANQLHHFMPVRAAMDGRYKYLRSYLPYRQFALRNYYQWGMPSNKAWDEYVMSGKNNHPEWAQTFGHHEAEMLFDLANDPFELNDLSRQPAYAKQLERFRQAMKNHVRSTQDLGFFLPSSRQGVNLYNKVRQDNYPMEQLYRAAELAGTAATSDVAELERGLTNKLPDIRFWSVAGLAQLASNGKLTHCPKTLLKLITDEQDPYIAAEAAYAVSYLGYAKEGVNRLVNPRKEEERKIGYSALECLSLDKKMQKHILPYLPQLKEAAENLPRKENEDAGLIARGLLVNLGALPIKDLHGQEAYEEGLKLNKGRRPMVPLPNPTVDQKKKKLIPLTGRVNVQAETADFSKIIDGEWVAVGTNKTHAIQHDYTRPFEGKPSYRFELKQEDNTLEGYGKGETKGRAELSYCYATNQDFEGKPSETYQQAQVLKTVYHHGKGSCPQGSSMSYTFSVWIPSDLDKDVCTIFAQWHGMPSRTLVRTPQGEVKQLTPTEFVELDKTMTFKKDTGYDKATRKKNGWLVEQGGYPPLAFGFNDGWFNIKANSDRKWMTDKTDRCNANPTKTDVMKPVKSKYKASTIAYKMPFEDFPKDCWITFDVAIDWTVYGREKETIERPGRLDVQMSYQINGRQMKQHIVNNERILIGRNDDDGYYFKFGIYRVGGSTVPVTYNLAGYCEHLIDR